MNCNKCTATPNTNYGKITLYIDTYADHLKGKLSALLMNLGYSYKVHHQDTDVFYYILEDCDFETVIDQLETSGVFTDMEKYELFLLPMPGDKRVGFQNFKETKPLSFWITLREHADVVSAIAGKRIKTLFQPIYHTQTLEVYGHEALSRAVDEEGNLISAGKLFDVANRLDLLFNLDKLCRHSAIQTASDRNLSGMLFINFLPTAIYDPNVCLQTTHQIVKDTKLKPENFVFEVVESDFVADYKHLVTILDHYREKGYQTALDDIGSGYSTLTQFDRLRTNYIKLDMTMVNGIHNSKDKQLYLEHLLDLKAKTGVKIIAEGVEYQPDYDYIKSLPVDFVQGFLFSEPM